MNEIWVFIIGYRGLYQVSNYGRVRSMKGVGRLSGKILKPGRSNGYLKVNLVIPKKIKLNGRRRTHTMKIHWAVARAFISKPRSMRNPVINHKNLNKHDNCVANLEWIESSANTWHAIRERNAQK